MKVVWLKLHLKNWIAQEGNKCGKRLADRQMSADAVHVQLLCFVFKE